jgi:hypothetical protein
MAFDRDMPTEMQNSSIRILILEIIISMSFIGLALLMWSSKDRSNSSTYSLAGAAMLVAGAMVFVSAKKSILKDPDR